MTLKEGFVVFCILFLASCEDREVINRVIVRDEVHGLFSIESYLSELSNDGGYYQLGVHLLLYKCFDSIRIQLLKDGRVFRETYSDGNKFVFKQVPYGKYDIKFIINDEVSYLKSNIEIKSNEIPNLLIDGVFSKDSNMEYLISSDYTKVPRIEFRYRKLPPVYSRLRAIIDVLSDNIDANLQIIDMQGNILKDKTFENLKSGIDTLEVDIDDLQDKMFLLYASYLVDNKKYFFYTTFISTTKE